MPSPQHRKPRVLCCPADAGVVRQVIDDNLQGIDWMLKFPHADGEIPDLAVIVIDHAPEAYTIKALCDHWITKGLGTVVRLENGAIRSRLMIVSEHSDATIPTEIRFYLDGSDDVPLTIGSAGSDEREKFLDELQVMLTFVDQPVLGRNDVDGLEWYIRDRHAKQFPPLAYHNPHHIFDVYEACGRIAAGEGVTGMDLALLRIAALFHDAGFIHTYDHHEARGADMAAAVMPVFGFDADQIRTVCGMILATRVPQRPATHLERILCDADLDYLGRDDFYTIGRKLYEELRSAGAVDGEDAWNQLQVKFLGSHGYHTSFSRHHREPAKQERLKEIRSLIEP